MPHPVECLFKINKDVVEVLLVLTVFLTQNSNVEDLLCGTSSTSKASLLFSYAIFCLWLQSIQNDFQHHFAHMNNEADGSVVLTEVHVSFLGECDDE